MKPLIYLLLIGFLLVLGCTEEEENTPEQKAPAFVGSWIAEKVSVDGMSRDEFENSRWTFKTDSLLNEGQFHVENLPDIEDHELQYLSYGNWRLDPNNEDAHFFFADDLGINYAFQDDLLILSFAHYSNTSDESCCTDSTSVLNYSPFSAWLFTLRKEDSNDQ